MMPRRGSTSLLDFLTAPFATCSAADGASKPRGSASFRVTRRAEAISLCAATGTRLARSTTDRRGSGTPRSGCARSFSGTRWHGWRGSG